MYATPMTQPGRAEKSSRAARCGNSVSGPRAPGTTVVSGDMRRQPLAVLLLLLAACGGDGGGVGAGGAPASLDDAAKACVAIGSCIPDDGVNDCFDDLLPVLGGDQIRCAAGAVGDCARLYDCIGVSATVGTTSCAADQGCQGDTLVGCDDPVRFEVNCAAPLAGGGGQCLLDVMGRPTCGSGTCAADGERCDGTKLVRCYAGVERTHDCAESGLACAADANGVACVGTGAACTAGTADRCDGAALVSCLGGKEARMDCGKNLAGGCFSAPDATGGTSAFCGFGDECNVNEAKGMETCFANALTFCAGGLVRTVDCVNLGFTGCSADYRGCTTF